MKSALWFNIGVGIDTLVLLLSLSSVYLTRDYADGLSPMGPITLILIPLVLLVLIGAAFWLKSIGKIHVANILLWIPALPMAGGILLWGGLALIFILFSK